MNTSPEMPPEDAALWERAWGAFGAFEVLFGTALQLVGQVFLPRREANAARAFLRGLEMLIRRLLLARAAELSASLKFVRRAAKQPATNDHPPPSRREPERAEGDLHPEDASLWRAPFPLRVEALLFAEAPEGPARHATPQLSAMRTSFRCRIGTCAKDLLGKTALCAAACADARAGEEDPMRKWARGAGLARRLEAARRVLDDPDRWARRLARALSRVRSNRPPRLALAPFLPPDAARYLEDVLDRAASACERTLPLMRFNSS